MFLFFSKLIGFFIIPDIWLIVLFAWRLFAKSPRTKKRLTIVLVTFVFVFGNEFLYTKLANAWQPKQVQLTKQYQAGILLGGLCSFDKYGNGYLNTSSDRLIAICTLYKTGVIKKIVIAAGNINKDQPNEAAYIFVRMAELGIDKADIIIEGRSRNTFENAVFAKQKIDSIHLSPPYVLVTSAMHMPRATRVFKKAGLSVVPYPCNYEVLERKFSWDDFLVPKLYVISEWQGLLKEVVGLAGYKLFGKA